jgi:hypothetical protein
VATLTRGLVALRTVRACGDTFPAILVGLEDGLTEFVAFDGEFGCLCDGAVERPVARAGGPYGDNRRVWICAVFEPIASPIDKGCGCDEPVAVAGGGRDLAFDGGSDVDGVHLLARLWLRPLTAVYRQKSLNFKTSANQ